MSLTPALYIGHGAPPLLDDPLWSSQLSAWGDELRRPTAILVVSAHWESAPLTLGSTSGATPLIYDFGDSLLGFTICNIAHLVHQI